MVEPTLSGVSVALRTPHLPALLGDASDLEWVELMTDNWLHQSGLDQKYLMRVCERYHVSLHGVSMNLGGIAPLDWSYLGAVKALMKTTDAKSVSDHVCFSHVGTRRFHDLLPVPYTEESLQHMSKRIAQVQDFLECRILVENASAYLSYRESTFSEAEFLTLLCEVSGCGLLLDLNNIHVTSHNLGESSEAFLTALDRACVDMLHLGGFTDKGEYLLDSHGHRISEDVWMLFREFMHQRGQLPTVIEWDNDLPSFDILMAERAKAQRIMMECEHEFE